MRSLLYRLGNDHLCRFDREELQRGGGRMAMMCRNKRKDRGRLVLISKWNETFVALRDILFVSAMFC